MNPDGPSVDFSDLLSGENQKIVSKLTDGARKRPAVYESKAAPPHREAKISAASRPLIRLDTRPQAEA